MDKLSLKKGGAEELKQVAIEVPHGEDVKPLIAEMWSIMRAHKGIGLAANQVGVLQRVIVVSTTGFTGAIINPKVTKWSGSLKRSTEGCLSYQGRKVSVKRDNIVVVEGFDQNWKPIKKKIRALSAFCVQHEIDHLNGLTIDRYSKI